MKNKIVKSDQFDVHLVPPSLSMDIGESTSVSVIYSPTTWPDQRGQWIIDDPSIVTDLGHTDAIIFVSAIAHGSTKIHYIPDSDNTKDYVCDVNVGDQPVLTELILDPQKQTVAVGDEFHINIQYVPDDAPHTGQWYPNDDVQLLTKSTPEVGYFKALKSVDSTTLIYMSGNNILGTSVVDIRDFLLDSINISPPTENVFKGDTFWIDVTYNPTIANPSDGQWHWSGNALQLMDDSTATRGHFEVINDITSPIDITFVNYGTTSNVNICTSNKPESLRLNPVHETVSKGDNFSIDIIWPDGAKKDAIWVYNTDVLRLVSSSDSRGNFLVLDDSLASTTIQCYSFSVPESTDDNYCYFVEKEKVSLKLSPQSETKKFYEMFTINITWDTNAVKDPVWAYDSKYISLLSQDKDSATFIVIDDSDISDIQTTITCTSKSDPTSTDTNTCYIPRSGALTPSLKLSPEHVSKNVGDTFEIDIIWTNVTTKDPMWDFEHTVFKMLSSTDSMATFQVLNTNTTNSQIRCFSQSNRSLSDTCSCDISSTQPYIVLTPISETTRVGEIFKVSANVINGEQRVKWKYNASAFGNYGEDDTNIWLVWFTDTYSSLPITATYYNDDSITSTNTCYLSKTPLPEKPIVTVNPTSETRNIGETFYLEASVTNSDNKGIVWNYNPNTFSIDEQGNNHATFTVLSDALGSKGSISAVAMADYDVWATNICTIGSNPQPQKPVVTVNPTSETKKVGDTFTITATVVNGSQPVTWSYDSNTLSKVSEARNQITLYVLNDLVSSTTITATSMDDSSAKASNTCYIQSNPGPDPNPTKVKEIFLDPSATTVAPKADFSISVHYEPSDSNEGKSYHWVYDSTYIYLYDDITTSVRGEFQALQNVNSTEIYLICDGVRSGSVYMTIKNM